FLRELRDAGRRRVQAQLQRVEIQAAWTGDNDLAVDNAVVRKPVDERVVELRKIAVERTRVAALDEHIALRTEDDRAKAVPLGLVEDLTLGRDRFRHLGEHRFDRGLRYPWRHALREQR